MKTIVFATNNAHKLSEIREIVGEKINILSLGDIDCHEEIPEDGNTLEDNSLQKARFVSEKFGIDCFADDTGLFVDSLCGLPGVHTARYAGENATSDDNVDLLLANLEGERNRNAYFRTVITFIEKGKALCFDGRIDGVITDRRIGNDGFGYDPVFIPEGYDETFAQLGVDVKNKISHRAVATKKFVEYLLSE